jgi:hypothetical protein
MEGLIFLNHLACDERNLLVQPFLSLRCTVRQSIGALHDVYS